MISSYLTQITITLIFLINLAVIARLLVKRKQPLLKSKKNNQLIEIIDKKQISHKEQLILIKVCNQTLLLGATAHQITTIKQINIDGKQPND